MGSYVAEVDAYLARTARATGIPDPDESERHLRYVCMGLFMSQALERSSAPAAEARKITVDLLAMWLGTTPQGIEDLITANPE